MNEIRINKFAPLSYACEEAVNTLCTNLSFSGAGIKKIMVTSSHASEGKSFITMNVMRTLARLDKTITLVDADLRRSMINSEYGIKFPEGSKRLGLSHYLAGMAEPDDILYATNIENAYMVPVGRDVTNALPLLNSPRFSELLDALAEHSDYVIVDAPPVGTVIDAAQISKSCDGTLLVVGYNSVRRKELVDVKEQLERTGCPILGAVLNMVEMDDYVSKKYYYKSYYSHYNSYYSAEEEEEEEDRARSARRKKSK